MKMLDSTKVLDAVDLLLRPYETNEEPLPKAEEITDKALKDLGASKVLDEKAYLDLYDETFPQVEKLLKRVKLRSSPTANGSLTRVHYLAYSIPHARTVREGLWGNPEPLFSAGLSNESFWRAIEQVWAWVQDSPEVKRYEATVLTEVSADGFELLSGGETKTLKKPIRLPKHVEGGYVERNLPFTRRAYDLSDAIDEFRNMTAGRDNAPWWRPEWTAVYLTTGHFERMALPRWAVIQAGTQKLEDKRRGHIYIEVHDAASVSPSELAGVYTRTRERLTETAEAPKLEISAGRPEEYSSEVLAQLELELILEKAYERFAEGQSVSPEEWDERPKNKELVKAWDDKAVGLGIDLKKRPTPQILSNFRSRVRRRLYETALRRMHTEDDRKRAREDAKKIIEESERIDEQVRKAFDRTPKEQNHLNDYRRTTAELPQSR